MARTDSFFEDASRKRKRGTGNKQQGEGGERRAGAGANRGGSSSRGRGGSGRGSGGGKGKGREINRHDEELGGSGSDSGLEGNNDDDDDEDLVDGKDGGDFFDSEEEADAKETPAQKRLRLAKMYLDSLKAGQKDEGGFDAADLERDIIAERLQKDVLEVSGRLHLRLADRLSLPATRSHRTSNKVHRLPLTCATASDDCRYLFTASKDGSIARWDISSLLSLPSTSALPINTEASTSTSSSTSQPKIVKLDFQPKRSSSSSSSKKGKSRKHFSESKGKAPIARNQPSQDSETRGHTDDIYSLAISSDGKRLASGGADRKIGIWDISNTTELGKGCKWVSGLRGHKDSIVSLKFRIGTLQLYTSSWDRTVKIYDASALTYIETLFGHQDKIYDLSVLKNEIAVTAGGRDKTLRYWKVKEESQLVFRAGGMSKIRRVIEGGLEEEDGEDSNAQKAKALNGVNGQSVEKRFVEGSADCTAMIDDSHFLSGGDSGTISLWNTGKKKPIFSIPLAHGLHEIHSETEGLISNPRWITSLASLPYSDIFASGSWDGKIRLWKISEDMKSFSALSSSPSSQSSTPSSLATAQGEIEAIGFVNSLQMIQLPSSRATTNTGNAKKNASAGMAKGALLVAALGQEHKFGRWLKVPEAKNQALVVVIEEMADV